MQILILALALFLMLNLGAGMWRVLRGPTAADRMLAAQLFGTTAVAKMEASPSGQTLETRKKATRAVPSSVLKPVMVTSTRPWPVGRGSGARGGAEAHAESTTARTTVRMYWRLVMGAL